MKLIVGLGNPGRKYERTRHNAGFMAIEKLAGLLEIGCRQEKHDALIGKGRLDSDEIILAMPQTFMNESGRAVGALIRSKYGSVSDLIVIHDELDLPFGTIRIKTGGGHGGHNGLRSIMDHLGSPEFIRVRVGIGRPAPGMDTVRYVLAPFLEEERRVLPDVMARTAEAAKTIIREGPARAMNLFNQK